ncbi:class I glutamine amidotransferase-like protein [Ceraceosorus guamensis]|uniref:Class I glutamine amidotransferase-like protein n=1 Tax=Ceraceosorus guamensis TaxID=1522189 RepID=A0A316W2W5_9BASI|nr:class I glutamine amidotransferase-like protein [Ceraceosorus guamensis]PWN43844.1 class I glutamine amidotransferase-like protein [Ceraceosorus guamensis]
MTSSATSSDTLRMLVLETDDPHPKTLSERGSFGQIFHDLFESAGSSHSPHPLKIETSMHFVVDDAGEGKFGRVPRYEEIGEDVGAILISGSMYDAHGDDEWILQLLQLLQHLWSRRPLLKFSGVCFGHQLLNRMLGCQVRQHAGQKWELSHTEMNLTPIGKKLFRTDEDTLALHQMHQDQVVDAPTPETSNGLLEPGTRVHIWASSQHTKVQGVYIRDRLFTSQGHLGFDDTMVHRQIQLRKEAGSIDESDKMEVAQAREKAHLEHDGVVVAAAILRFFHGEDHDVE